MEKILANLNLGRQSIAPWRKIEQLVARTAIKLRGNFFQIWDLMALRDSHTRCSDTNVGNILYISELNIERFVMCLPNSMMISGSRRPLMLSTIDDEIPSPLGFFLCGCLFVSFTAPSPSSCDHAS